MNDIATPVAAAEPVSLEAVADRARALLESWDELQAAGWNAPAAAVQYEELEWLVEAIERVGHAALSDATVALAAYLFTFVDARREPTNSQRARLGELVEQLRAALRALNRPERDTVDEGVQGPILLSWVDDARAPAGLQTQFVRSGMQVSACYDLAAALAQADQRAPDVIVVDAEYLPKVESLIRRAESARGEVRGKPVCVVLGSEFDAATRLFALRAGVDAMVESADAADVVVRIGQLLGQQRHLGFRVLIVEDDRAQAMFVESVLRHRGISTRSCTAAEEVMDALRDFRPDLVLLDLYLPGANGIEVAQWIRERSEFAFLPIVFLSGETDLDKRFDAIRMGGDDFLNKPIKPRHLLSVVEARIRRARQMPNRDFDPRADRRGALVSREQLVDDLRELLASPAAENAALVLVNLVDEARWRDELGLIVSGHLAQELGAALAGDIDLIRPVCAAGEFAFVGLLQAGEGASLSQRLEQLRQRFDKRRWLDEQALQLPLTVAALGLAGRREGPNFLLSETRALAKNAKRGDEPVCLVFEAGRRAAVEPGEAPERRFARALLKGSMVPEAIRCEFQALVPIRGEEVGQYAVRFALVAPKASQALEVRPERLRALAQELGATVQCDRHCIKRALLAISAQRKRGDELRLLLPIAVETALDQSFAPWIATELQGQSLSPASVTLALDAGELMRTGAPADAALEALAVTGVRLMVMGLEGGEAHLRLVRHVRIGATRLNPPSAPAGAADAWGSERGRLIVEANKRGKVVVADQVRDARELAELVKLGAHYIQSDLFAPWAPEPSFDFAGAKL
jgi:DNA-binding response OmpR family regulator/EAL domain-containing protein (putative c-di-GMP-specific phosphodiesterase class I)